MFLTPRTLTYQRHEQQPEVPGKLCFRVHFHLFQENSGIFFKNIPCIKRYRHKTYVVILRKQLPVDVRTIKVRALSSLSLQACETVFPCNTIKSS